MIISQATDIRTLIRAYITLTKPRIIMMLLFTALGGLFLASRGVPDLATTLLVLVGGTLASAGANALNQSMDRDIDEAMRRTQTRPVVVGMIPSHHAVIFGIAVNIIAFILLASLVNVLSAVLTLGATLFYVIVYTKALKRTSTQNIVIGGAAGAIPPMVGWTAVTGTIGLPAIYLFAIVFFWTPPHFWALALLLKDDYARAKVPMLPVVAGVWETKKSILLYTVLMLALTSMFYATGAVGLIYLVSSAVAGVLFIYYAWRLLRNPEIQGAKGLYLYSLLYLAILFTAIIVDSLVKF
ncbi:MAG: protoheme IX farnesyltransferase [SAR202 cluster bacterium Casp-Chloro-G4]|nr:heme o synthase [Chloroflexota bacterium]MDA1227964.1 heme o synthase [Chloroflexota bacterium]PKB61053.1 MAG: protoheme IX farnesyltransferase [SAR202 cluster bacterium Casp-Chloro-G4]